MNSGNFRLVVTKNGSNLIKKDSKGHNGKKNERRVPEKEIHALPPPPRNKVTPNYNGPKSN